MHMGPPPSPKEPRRSGRRSVPSASSSKSPAPSPVSDTGPRPTDPRRTPSTSSSRSKRSKQEDLEDTLEELPKIPLSGNNGRNKRKGGKDRDKQSTQPDNSYNMQMSTLPEESSNNAGDEEETRCICGSAEDDTDGGEFMVQCETCKVWQHGLCMGFSCAAQLDDDDYYCEQCRPDLHQDLLKKLAKQKRQASTTSHHESIRGPSLSRSPRSHSPVLSTKPQKRRNTMNSRDAAYDESVVKALIEATAVEAAASGIVLPYPPNNEHIGSGKHEDEVDAALPNRRKRKRTDDDNISIKRPRSASVTSDQPILSNISRDDPPSANGSKTTPTPTAASRPRQKRGGGRKSAHVAESVASADVDEVSASAPPKRPSRKAGQDGRRNHTSSARIDIASTNHPRAHHNTHAYAVSQQPLYTSWNLPDYLAHLEPMLPTDVPQPLEIRASGKDNSDASIERGVKVKWPSKRTSIGDMNKRVRSLVEWVGREQASALERGRRKDALFKALRDLKQRQDAVDGEGGMVVLDGKPLVDSPLPEQLPAVAIEIESDWVRSPTMKLMEEVMEELISFQERFGPGSKSKDRERRVVS